jgi:organic hydroperoxide reductase OsmC/OhrA
MSVKAEIQVPPTVHHARVVWTGDKSDLRSHTIELAGEAFAASAAPELGGNGEKADPEELLVASLSSCHMLWFLDYARRERLRIASYEDDAEGAMDGTRFTGVVLRPRVSFERDPGPEKMEELHHLAHERCFIARSVNFPVEVEPR